MTILLGYRSVALDERGFDRFFGRVGELLQILPAGTIGVSSLLARTYPDTRFFKP
jgi:hypothetical protein